MTGICGPLFRGWRLAVVTDKFNLSATHHAAMSARFLALILFVASAAAQAAVPSHLYRLDGNLLDDYAGPALISNGGTLDASGYSFGANEGLTLPLNLGAAYTIDLRFHFDDVNSGWNKIIDFKSLSSDNGMYTLNGGWDFCCGPGVGNFSSIAAGVDARLTLTRNGAGEVNVYINGALGRTVGNDNGIADFAGNSARFFIDDVVTGQHEARAGRVDFIRTFNGALSASQVAALSNDPTSPVPEPAAGALFLLGLAGVAARASRR